MAGTCPTNGSRVDAKGGIEMDAQGKRSRGRPKLTWRRTMERQLKEHNLTIETATRQAEDRQQ